MSVDKISDLCRTNEGSKLSYEMGSIRRVKI